MENSILRFLVGQSAEISRPKPFGLSHRFPKTVQTLSLRTKQDQFACEGHFRMRTTIVTIMKGLSKPKCSISNGPSEWGILKGTTYKHFRSYDSLHRFNLWHSWWKMTQKCINCLRNSFFCSLHPLLKHATLAQPMAYVWGRATGRTTNGEYFGNLIKIWIVKQGWYPKHNCDNLFLHI